MTVNEPRELLCHEKSCAICNDASCPKLVSAKPGPEVTVQTIRDAMERAREIMKGYERYRCILMPKSIWEALKAHVKYDDTGYGHPYGWSPVTIYGVRVECWTSAEERTTLKDWEGMAALVRGEKILIINEETDA